MNSSERKNNEGFVPTAITAATILQNMVIATASEGPSAPRANGGGDNALQLAYIRDNSDVRTNPLGLDFHMSNDENYGNLMLWDNVFGRDSLDMPNLGEVGVSREPPVTSLSQQCAALFGDDSDNDFVDPPPKSLSQSKKQKKSPQTPKRDQKCASASSVGVAGEDTKMAVEERTTPYKLKSIGSSPGQTSDAPMLRAALTTKRSSQAESSKQTTDKKKSAKQPVRQGVVAKRSKSAPKKKAPVSATVTVEPSCSTVIPTEAPKPNIVASPPKQVSSQDHSDSETEFEILSQPEDRTLAKSFNNFLIRSEAEFKANDRKFRTTTNSVRSIEMNKQGVANDLRRLDEERQELVERIQRIDEDRQRLLEQQEILDQSHVRSKQELKEDGARLEKSYRKMEFIKRMLKKVFD